MRPESGFDGVCMTEHSQSTYDISPNPNLMAAAVAYGTPRRGPGHRHDRPRPLAGQERESR